MRKIEIGLMEDLVRKTPISLILNIPMGMVFFKDKNLYTYGNK